MANERRRRGAVAGGLAEEDCRRCVMAVTRTVRVVWRIGIGVRVRIGQLGVQRALIELCVAVDAELTHGIALLRADGLLRAMQFRGDLGDRHSRNIQSKDLDFALAQ